MTLEATGPTRAADAADVEIRLCPNGPMLIRGPVTIVDSSGVPLPRTRPTIALCRCGKTSIAPYCDGTHRLIRRTIVTGSAEVADAGGATAN
jgi:CDGSH-type Zn-finger protein